MVPLELNLNEPITGGFVVAFSAKDSVTAVNNTPIIAKFLNFIF
jgi:hypothetical protein